MTFKTLLLFLFLSYLIFPSQAQVNPDSVKFDIIIRNNMLHGSFLLHQPDSVKLTIYNALGIVLLYQNQYYEAGNNEVILPFIQDAGIYFLKIEFKAGNKFTFKFINEINAITSSENEDVKVYPNPFSEVIFIQSCNNCNYRISNQLGSLMSFASTANSSTYIDTSTLPSGFYFVEIIQGHQKEIFNMVK